MTKTKRVLNQLAKGAGSALQLAEATGIDVDEVRRVLSALKFKECIATTPVMYTLTPRGQVKQKRRPKTPSAVIAKKVIQRRERVEKAKRPLFDSGGMVANTIKSQPTSVFQLGGM